MLFISVLLLFLPNLPPMRTNTHHEPQAALRSDIKCFEPPMINMNLHGANWTRPGVDIETFRICSVSNICYLNGSWFYVTDSRTESPLFDKPISLVSRCQWDQPLDDCHQVRLQPIDMLPHANVDILTKAVIIHEPVLLLHHLYKEHRTPQGRCQFQFGHELLDHILPVFHALLTVRIQPETVHIFFDDCSLAPASLAQSLWQLLGIRGVSSLVNSTHVGMPHCFDHIIMGVGQAGLMGQSLGPGEIHQFRDHVLRILGITRKIGAAEMMVTPFVTDRVCVIDRHISSGRKLVNLMEIIVMIRTEIANTTWSVDIIHLDQMSLAHQILTIHSCKLLIGIVGTGMHQVPWLADGAGWIDLLHPFHSYVNEYLCRNSLRVHCQAAGLNHAVDRYGRVVVEGNHTAHYRNMNLKVNITELRLAVHRMLQWCWKNDYCTEPFSLSPRREHCIWEYKGYHPSALEQSWIQNIANWSHDPCKAVAAQQQEIDSWVNASHANSSNDSVFSWFTYRNTCTQEHLAIWIEPLAGPGRHPYICQTIYPYVMDKSYLYIDQAEAHLLYPRSRVYYFDLGASLWNSGSGGASQSWIYEYYKDRGIVFDHIFAWEAETIDPQLVWEQIPPEVRQKYHWFNVRAVPDVPGPENPLEMLKSIATPDDFVVLKIDIDGPQEVEEAFIQQILREPALSSLIDDMYYEHHINVEPMTSCCWAGMKGSMWTLHHSYDRFIPLRSRGVRIHSWV